MGSDNLSHILPERVLNPRLPDRKESALTAMTCIPFGSLFTLTLVAVMGLPMLMDPNSSQYHAGLPHTFFNRNLWFISTDIYETCCIVFNRCLCDSVLNKQISATHYLFLLPPHLY